MKYINQIIGLIGMIVTPMIFHDKIQVLQVYTGVILLNMARLLDESK